MKKILLFSAILFFTKILFAQTELKATMGVNFISVASMQDYINQSNYAPLDNQLGTFNAAVIFSVEGGYFLNSKFEMSVEIPYQIYSYNSTIVGAGQYNLSYDELLPSVMAYYVISGTGYNFKFGGGVGPRFVFVTEEKKWQGTSEDYSSIGFGGLLRVEANTSLADNIFANIGFDLRYDVNGEPENNNGKTLYNTGMSENVNFNTFSAGVKLGISYLIGGNN